MYKSNFIASMSLIVLVASLPVDASSSGLLQQASSDSTKKLEKLARGGDPPSMFLYARAVHSSKDEEYYRWINKSAFMGYGPAILTQALDEDTKSSDPKLSKETRAKHLEMYHSQLRSSFDGLMSWARSGDLESMYELGAYSETFAKEGVATIQDCLPWLEQAATQGHKEAPFNLALILLKQNDAISKLKGFEWMKKATIKGNNGWRAAVELARYYTYGFPEISLKRNPQEAWKWVKKGADLQGIPVDEFLESSGLQDPDKINESEILFR